MIGEQRQWRRAMACVLLTCVLLGGFAWLACLRPSGDLLSAAQASATGRRDRSEPAKHEPEPAAMDDAIVALQAEAEISPELAMAGAAGLGDEALVAVAAVWAASHPDDAILWVNGLEPERRDPLLAVLSVELAASRPTDALKLADSISVAETRGDSVGFVLAQMAGTQPDEVFEWLGKSDSEAVARRRWERQALAALAVEDPLRVGHWISDGKVHPAAEESAVAAVVRSWSRFDAAGAATWITAFPDPRMRRGAMLLVMERWATDEPDAAAEWILNCPHEGAREDARAALTATLDQGLPGDVTR